MSVIEELFRTLAFRNPPTSYAGIGSRETPPEVCEVMTFVAQMLADAQWHLRSGGAEGADKAFEKGVSDPRHMTIFRPGLPTFPAPPGYVFGSSQEAFEIAEDHHPNWDRCSPQAKSLHARNSHIVLGDDLLRPVKFIICWTKDGKVQGGTGQALRIANAQNPQIPIFNMGKPRVYEMFASFTK